MSSSTCQDPIGELVDHALKRGPTDDYTREWDQRCPHCHRSWHGLPTGRCPGVYATPEQLQQWQDHVGSGPS